MKKFSAILITALLSISLVGCSGMSNQDSGTLVGGVAGGLIGSQFGGGGGLSLTRKTGELDAALRVFVDRIRAGFAGGKRGPK